MVTVSSDSSIYNRFAWFMVSNNFRKSWNFESQGRKILKKYDNSCLKQNICFTSVSLIFTSSLNAEWSPVHFAERILALAYDIAFSVKFKITWNVQDISIRTVALGTLLRFLINSSRVIANALEVSYIPRITIYEIIK